MRQRTVTTTILLALSLALAPAALGQTPDDSNPDPYAPEPGYYHTHDEVCDTHTAADGTTTEDCRVEIWKCPEPTEDTSTWTDAEWTAYEDANCVFVESGYTLEHEVCETHTDASGNTVEDCWWEYDYCPYPEYRGMDDANWTDADYAAYEQEHCRPVGTPSIGADLPCDEPDDAFWNWSFADQRQWFTDNCATDWCPAPTDADGPADGSGWSRAEWFKWIYYSCMDAPCGDPPEEFWTYTDDEQDAWMQEHCPHTFLHDPHMDCDPYDAGHDPEAEGWTPEEWMEWFYYDCDGAPCGDLPTNFWDMSPEERRAWYEANCPDWYEPPHAPTGCHPPPETGFPEMTDAEKRQWVIDHCGDQCPDLPATTSGWTGDDWRAYFESCHMMPPCSPPPEFKDWTDAERHQWVVEHCADVASCPDLPSSTDGWEREQWEQFFADCFDCAPFPSGWANYTDAERDEWFRTNCGPDATGDGGDPNGGDAGDDGDANDNGIPDEDEEQARRAAEEAANRTGDEQIVVPGFSPLFALAGLGAVGLLLRRR